MHFPSSTICCKIQVPFFGMLFFTTEYISYLNDCNLCMIARFKKYINKERIQTNTCIIFFAPLITPHNKKPTQKNQNRTIFY